MNAADMSTRLFVNTTDTFSLGSFPRWASAYDTKCARTRVSNQPDRHPRATEQIHLYTHSHALPPRRESPPLLHTLPTFRSVHSQSKLSSTGSSQSVARVSWPQVQGNCRHSLPGSLFRQLIESAMHRVNLPLLITKSMSSIRFHFYSHSISISHL